MYNPTKKHHLHTFPLAITTPLSVYVCDMCICNKWTYLHASLYAILCTVHTSTLSSSTS